MDKNLLALIVKIEQVHLASQARVKVHKPVRTDSQASQQIKVAMLNQAKAQKVLASETVKVQHLAALDAESRN